MNNYIRVFPLKKKVYVSESWANSHIIKFVDMIITVWEQAVSVHLLL